MSYEELEKEEDYLMGMLSRVFGAERFKIYEELEEVREAMTELEECES